MRIGQDLIPALSGKPVPFDFHIFGRIQDQN
jgi:hypothetical protein